MDDNDYLGLVIDSVTDFAILTTDEAGVIRLWNAGAQHVFGWSAAEAEGEDAGLIFTPEDRAAGVPEAELQAAMAKGCALDERWHIRKDGTRFFASGVMSVLRRDGRHVGFVKIARDLTERKRLEDALREAHESLERRVSERTAELMQRNAALTAEIRAREDAEARTRSLLDRVVSIQEVERRRVARNIHDELGQTMTALKWSLEALGPGAGANAALLERSRHLARELDSAIDFLTWELRPASVGRATLSTVVAELVASWSERFAIPARFAADGDHQLPQDAQEHVYRLTQEALHNVAKHAGASDVRVVLERRDDELRLSVQDDGCGFSVDGAEAPTMQGGLGLTSMRERAALAGGTLLIESAAGRGTALQVRIPLRATASQPSTA